MKIQVTSVNSESVQSRKGLCEIYDGRVRLDDID